MRRTPIEAYVPHLTAGRSKRVTSAHTGRRSLEMPAAPGDLAVDVVHVHDEVSTPDAEWAAGGSFAETYAEEMADHVRNADRIPSAVEVAVERSSRATSSTRFTNEAGGRPRQFSNSRTNSTRTPSFSASAVALQSGRCCSAASYKQ